MTTKTAGLSLIFCLAATLSRALESGEPIAFDVQPGRVVIRAGRQPVATYVYRDAKIPRPYFKDLHTPGGTRVTRHHPPREGIDRTDHASMHPGLWLAFGDLGGVDFWRNRGKVQHVEFTKPPASDGQAGGFTVRNRYRGKDTVVCEEICAYTFLNRPSGLLILWDSTFRSDTSSFAFGDQEEMGLGVRLATAVAVKSEKGGRILDSRGRRNEKAVWGKSSTWCDYSGWIGGVFAGVAIMPDPSNFRPCWWHARDYGFMAANPFGRAAFHAGPPSKIEVAAKEPLRLRYGVFVHGGKAERAIDVAAAYQDFLAVLKQMDTKSKKGQR